MGPPNYYFRGFIPSYTHLQPWLNRVCWGYNYLITKGEVVSFRFWVGIFGPRLGKLIQFDELEDMFVSNRGRVEQKPQPICCGFSNWVNKLGFQTGEHFFFNCCWWVVDGFIGISWSPRKGFLFCRIGKVDGFAGCDAGMFCPKGIIYYT